jgi:gamma-glutamyltranspeptidase/glutathione hydrolase
MRSSTRRLLAGAATIAALAAAAAAPAARADKRPTASGTGGAAATVDQFATEAAIHILRKGGNATDAAVAAAAVLGVVEPFSCGIGGGGFMVSYDRAGRRVSTIDSREKAPAAMRPDSFFENGKALSFDAARWSGLSAGVPGTVAAWEKALRRDGTMTLAQVLRPAIRVARRGFLVDRTFFEQVDAARTWFDDVPSTRALYLDADGTPRDVGARIRNPDLAKTYEIIARRGARGFYRGPVAGAIVTAATRPPVDANADHVWRPGLMTAADMHDYRAVVRKPVHTRFYGFDVYGMGPPSSGGTTVAEILNIAKGIHPRPPTYGDALHTFVEASRLAFADRNAFVADPTFFAVPLQGLLSDSFAGERRALIGPTAATSPVAPGNPYDDQPASAQAGRAAVTHPRQSTTNLTIADRRGNVVEYTFTIESTGGNGIVVPGYGFLLNNELTDFNYDSTTHPNKADSRKRPRSSIAPTIVLRRDGRPALAVGSPGGATIITTVAQILLEGAWTAKTLPELIATPRLSQRNSATTQVEPGFEQTHEGQALLARGHRFSVVTAAHGEIGAATAIEFLRGGRLLAAAEPARRGGGSAMTVAP